MWKGLVDSKMTKHLSQLLGLMTIDEVVTFEDLNKEAEAKEILKKQKK